MGIVKKTDLADLITGSGLVGASPSVTAGETSIQVIADEQPMQQHADMPTPPHLPTHLCQTARHTPAVDPNPMPEPRDQQRPLLMPAASSRHDQPAAACATAPHPGDQLLGAQAAVK
jgi:hypothetical protein